MSGNEVLGLILMLTWGWEVRVDCCCWLKEGWGVGCWEEGRDGMAVRCEEKEDGAEDEKSE